MAVKKNAALGFIFVTLLIDCLGIGIIIPVLPSLLKGMTGGDLSKASLYGGVLMATYAVMQFVCSPIAGGLSDRYGRRPVLLLSLLGLGIDYLFLAFAPTIGLFFIGRIIAGAFGASFTTASAYIADISTPEKRAQNFGMIGAAFGIGFMLGPAIGGLFSKFGLRVPFMIAAGFSLLNFLYGYFILPESLSKENRRSFEWKRANPVGALMHIRRYPSIISLLIATALLAVAGHAAQSTWTYINMEKFKWTEEFVGYSLSVVGLLVGLVQGGLIRVIIPKIGQKNTVFVGLAMYAIGFVLFALATKGWMMFVFLVPYCLGGIAMPAIQGIVSTKIPANEQGELQGVMTSLMTWLFHYFTSPASGIYFPGAPFIMGAVLTMVSIGIAANSLSSWHPPVKAKEVEG
jgi:DHA1 family tetracycline resistance protein-like MFS transporter